MILVKNNITPFLLIFLFVCCSCSANTKKTNPDKKFNDTAKVNIQLPKLGEKDFFYKDVNHLSQILKLDSLQAGYDSIQIRIWYPKTMGRSIIIIRKHDQKWQAFLYTVNYENSVGSDSTGKVQNYSQKEIFPKISWEELMKRIFSLGIESLPDMDEIPEYDRGGIDGFTYNFEIATKQSYRFYSYWMPYSYSNKLWQAKRIVEILKLIKDQFDLDKTISIEET